MHPFHTPVINGCSGNNQNTYARVIRLAMAGLLLFALPSLAQTNRALVVAIGKYPPESGWGVIDSQNDVPLIQGVLAKQKFTDVVLLTDRQADRAGILQALHDLIARCHKGDNVLIHFSSHGQQITDQNGDEADGLDEAIVCYGAPMRAEGVNASYDGSKHLRDEDLGALINDLRRQLGADGDVLLLADACHSGTITRGGGLTKHRGGPPLRTRQAQAVRAKTRTEATYKPFMYQKVISQSGLAPYVAMSAANASELNYQCYGVDGKEVGSLSYAFNQAMQQARVGESYRDLFARIQSIMKQKVAAQTPQIEGDIDRQLFGGAVVAQEAYLTVQRLGATNKQLMLATGQLEGIFDSTRVAVCARGTRDAKTGPVLAMGTVVKSTPYAATIQLDKPLPSGQTPADLWIFVTERSSGDLTVGIRLDSLTDTSLRQRVQTELARNRMVRFSGVPDLYVTANTRAGNTLHFHRADGTLLDAQLVPADQLALLSAQVQRYLQSQFLQRVNFAGNPSIQFSATLMPLKPGFKKLSDTLSQAAFRKGSLLGFKAFADTVALKITNNGTVPLYYTVLDIMPNGDVAVMLPQAYPDVPENYIVAPGKTVLSYKYVRFEPPYGKETFKIFATPQSVDLRRVVGQSRGPSDRQPNPLEQFFNSTNNLAQLGGTRGGSTGTLPDESNIATFNFEFLILKK